jgi:hypothetical protein
MRNGLGINQTDKIRLSEGTIGTDMADSRKLAITLTQLDALRHNIPVQPAVKGFAEVLTDGLVQ